MTTEEKIEDELLQQLIGFLKDCVQIDKGYFKRYGIDIDSILSWLEKQGKHGTIEKEYTFKSIPRLLDMIEPTDRAKSYCQKLIDSLLKEGYATDAKIVSDCLKQMNGEKVAMAVMDIEKQGEQKPIKVLHQPLKAKWYRMIEAGIKPEEYREPTVYWVRRLFHCNLYFDWCKESRWCFGCSYLNELTSMKKNTDYTHVQFSLGYPKKDDESRRMTFELKGIEYREGREEWGAEPGKKYFVEVLGRRTTLDGTKLWER